MSTKTFMLESNNSSAKLLTDRARKQARVGKNFVEENNSQWTTTINQGGLQINPGDEISISSTQINLRGEPDQCLEFNGSTNSTFKKSIIDNKTTCEFAFYVTNRQQYNMNLPLCGMKTTASDSWMERSYGLHSVLAEDHVWEDFSCSYPYVAIEGCAKRHCSTPFGAGTTDGTAQTGIIQEWWQLLYPNNPPAQETMAGQCGMMWAGLNTHTPFANSNFEIATPNETRMYVCNDDFLGLLPVVGRSSLQTPRKYSDSFLTQKIDFEVQEGFITPTALGSDLTTVFHQRTGDADAWTSEDVTPQVYVHNTEWRVSSLKETANYQFDGLGYWKNWNDNLGVTPTVPAPIPPATATPDDPNKFKLFRYPVTDITDKSYITVKTASGALLDKIWNDPNVAGSLPEWNTDAQAFGANIPNNDHFFYNGGDGSWGANYAPSQGRDLWYNNLLTGDINRTQSIQVWNEMANHSVSQSQLMDPGSPNYWKNWVQDLEDNTYDKKGRFRGNFVSWPAGPKYPAPNPAGDDSDDQGIFGAQVCLMDNYEGVKSLYEDPTDTPVDVAFDGLWMVEFEAAPPNFPTGELRGQVPVINNKCMSIRPGEDFQVVPLNIPASPMNIALMKKALYRSRELLPDSTSTLENESWTEDYVTRLDVGVKDDSVCVNANMPAGHSDPTLKARMASVPTPYTVAQAYLHGYNPANPSSPYSNPGNTGPIPPTLGPEGFDSYGTIDLAGPRLADADYYPPLPNNGLVRLGKDSKQNTQQKNSMLCRTFWHDDCDPKNKKIKLPADSQFSFLNGEGKMPDYTKYFKPGGQKNSIGANIEWEDGNEAGLDEGVGLCVVYFQNYLFANTGLAAGLAGHSLDNNVNKYYTDIANPPAAGQLIPGMGPDADRTMVPFLALVVPKVNADNNYRGLAYNQRNIPIPYIGEICGFSAAFSDGKYAKVVTTQRVNPKFYNTINEDLKKTNTKFLEQAFLFDCQYYNIFDYYPYIHVGAIDPQIQFSSTSGRFEISKFHTPATSSSGAWQDPQAEGNDGQSSDEIILMNSKRSFMCHASVSATIRGNQMSRIDTIGQFREETNRNLNTGLYGWQKSRSTSSNATLAIIPWGELHQDTFRQKTISSQAGIGLLNYQYYEVGDDGNTVTNNVNAFQPQLYEETMFSKMGFTIEQLLPFTGKQNSNFNRSNYNSSLGVNQLLIEKQNNMLYPFTTNGYSTSEQSFNTVTNSWVGYDTMFNVNGFVDGQGGGDSEGDPDHEIPPSSKPYSFFQERSASTNITGRPYLLMCDDSADNTTALLKELPPTEILSMFSLGGNNFATESVATADSDSLIASGLPSKFNYSYLVIYSDIVGQTSNFITGSNLMVTTPAIGYMTRNYSSADFMYSFDSDFNYIADRSFLLNNFNVEIRQPNGRLANIEDNSTIIFKIVKNIRPILPLPQPVLKDIVAKDKEEQKELDETINEFI